MTEFSINTALQGRIQVLDGQQICILNQDGSNLFVNDLDGDFYQLPEYSIATVYIPTTGENFGILPQLEHALSLAQFTAPNNVPNRSDTNRLDEHHLSQENKRLVEELAKSNGERDTYKRQSELLAQKCELICKQRDDTLNNLKVEIVDIVRLNTKLSEAYDDLTKKYNGLQKEFEVERRQKTKEFDAERARLKRSLKEAEGQLTKLNKVKSKQDKSEISQVRDRKPEPAPLQIHYDVSQQFPMIDDVESCLTQAQQGTSYQFKHASKDNSPRNLLLYFDIVDDRIRTVEEKREFAKSLLAQTNNNCVWVFVCFKPTKNEDGTKITNSIKGFPSGLTLPNGQFAQVYLTAEYQVKSTHHDKQGNFLHLISNKEEFKQKISSLVNMKVTGVQSNFPGMMIASPPPLVPTASNIVTSHVQASAPRLQLGEPVQASGVIIEVAGRKMQLTINDLTVEPIPPNSNDHVKHQPNANIAHHEHESRCTQSAESKSEDLKEKQLDQSSSSVDALAAFNPISILQKYEIISATNQSGNHQQEDVSKTVAISVCDQYPNSLQELAGMILHGNTTDASQLVIEARDMDDNWVIVDSDDALKELPGNIALPTVEFRAQDKQVMQSDTVGKVADGQELSV